MKNSLTRTLCTVVFVASAASAWAQYPTIPAAEKRVAKEYKPR